MLLFYPKHDSQSETILKFFIFLTPVWQLIWLVLLIMGKNESRIYQLLKLSLIGLISLTSIYAYFGAIGESTIYSALDSKIIFYVSMINITMTLLWSFFVLFWACLFVVASLVSGLILILLLPFILIYFVTINTVREGFFQISQYLKINRMRSIYKKVSTNFSFLPSNLWKYRK